MWAGGFEEELSVDVQGRGGTARGPDHILVDEGVSKVVVVRVGPRPCGLERGPLVREPGKPILRLTSCRDSAFQFRRTDVPGLVQSDLEAHRVVEFEVEIAVLTPVGESSTGSDGCDIIVKGDSEKGKIVAIRNRNTSCIAPGASVRSALDIDNCRRWLWHGRGRGYCYVETEDGSGVEKPHSEIL